MKLSHPLSLLLATALTLGTSHAATISLNFVGGGSSLSATDSAGLPDGQFGAEDTFVSNWNNGTGAVNTLNALVDSTGAVTTASASWTSSGAGDASIFTLGGTNIAGGQNPQMMSGYLDTFNGQTSTVTFTGLTLSTYSVIVYFDGDNGGDYRGANYTINGTTYSAEDSEGENFNSGGGNNANGVFQLPVASGSGDQNWPRSPNNNEGNYFVFTGLTGPSFTLSANPTFAGTQFQRAAINGIQVIGEPTAVPEPSTCLLLLLPVAYVISRRIGKHLMS